MGTTASALPDVRAYVYLGLRDPVLATLAARHGRPDPFRWPQVEGRVRSCNLAAMALHVISQQISTAAALTIHDRVLAAAGVPVLTADALLTLDVEELRAAGLSHAKARALVPVPDVRRRAALGVPARAGGPGVCAVAARGDRCPESLVARPRGRDHRAVRTRWRRRPAGGGAVSTEDEPPRDPWAPPPPPPPPAREQPAPTTDWRTMPPPEPPPSWQPADPYAYAPGPRPGQQPPPYAPGPPPQDGVSIASLVTGLLGLVLVSVVLAIVGLTRTADGRRRGRGFAVAGLALSIAWTVALAALLPGWLNRAPSPTPAALPVVAASSQSPSPDTPTPSPPASARPTPTPAPKPKPVPARKLYVDDLRTGNCLVTSKLGKSVLKVPVVPCRQGHDAEVIGVTRLTGRWHGEAALSRLSDQTCSRIFRRYVGVDIDASDYGMGWFSPTASSWRDGDRLLVCYADSGGSTMTGTVKGTSV